ncbi:flavin monoamine oxidase family protein [Salinicoccus kekensis]|uniref:Monoamine oxidase n=1 Tax=Salinicoccus kekensis TaxID=714307 RepID=A0A285US47_9STAP|nr:NAD(P)/FAD-dependent oxidoreductase [Salinicoccus kekensis]SOC43506.1 monoamine oxidase [Salinicoccus kekensis]
MTKNNYDVIVVGAGFAGVTASRELSNRGYDTLTLEARDRIGGRTWFDKRLGKEIEMGGTYIHWNQPHMWAEITRYGIEVKESPSAEHAYLATKDKVIVDTQEFMTQKLMEGMEAFLADAAANRYFERPFNPYHDDSLKEVDQYSVADKLREIQGAVTPEMNGLLNSLWSGYTSTSNLEAPGLAHAYRWAALTGHDMQEFQATFEQYSMKTGTKSLIESMMADSKSELKLSTPVDSVVKTTEGYKVVSREGEEFTCKAVVVAVPVNVLNDINFTPELSEEKRAFSEEKQASEGIKVWAKVRGLKGPSTFKATAEFPVNLAHTEFINEAGDEGIIMGFGSDSTLDMNDPKAVEKALRVWIPDLEVIESAGHNWVEDEFAKGTWGVIKKEQLTKYGQEVKRPEGGVFLAGSDFANGWAGYMDGAIETGLTTSREVSKFLQVAQTFNESLEDENLEDENLAQVDD